MSRRSEEWLSIKNSSYRKKLALILNTWRKNHNVNKTSKMLNISPPTILKALKRLNGKTKIPINKHFCSEDIKRQILEKHSQIRNEIAIYLNLWRKTKSITKIEKILKNSSRPKIRKFLSLSKHYHRKPRKNENYIEQQMKEKNSQRRIKLAKILNIWRKTKSIETTAKILNTKRKNITSSIQHSKMYLKSKFKQVRNQSNYSENLLKIKHSNYRKILAKILNTWRQTRSIKGISKLLRMSESTAIKMLNKSKTYANRKKYTRQEISYINTWGKKLWLINMLGGKCENCKNNNIFVLEFHHKDSSQKIDTISNLIWKRGIKTSNNSNDALRNEALKCILLCRNCHQSLHHVHFQDSKESIKLKQDAMTINGSKGCKLCGYSLNLACIEFHHPNPTLKENNIGTLIRSKKKLQKHINEFKQCWALCCNCHAEIHTKNIEKFKSLQKLIKIKEKALIEGYKPAW